MYKGVNVNYIFLNITKKNSVGVYNKKKVTGKFDEISRG